jgi:long-chain fatty acid transport protein
MNAMRTSSLIALLLALPATARGAGFAVVEQSAVAGGTAGAGVARASDPAAAWYNPAAFAGRRGLFAAGGLLVTVPKLNAAALDSSWGSDVQTGPRTPPHIYLSYAHRPFAAGVSVNVPFGSAVIWPEDWAGRYEIVQSQLQVWRIAPFVAYRIWRIAVSAGMHVDFANLQIRRHLDFVDTEGTVDLDLNDTGFGGHASLFVDLGRWVSVGASYKSRTRLGLEGGARFDDTPLSFSGRTRDQHASAGYTLPDLVTFGVEVRPHRRVSAVLDLGVTIWSVYEKLEIDFDNETTPDVQQINNWETRLAVRAGTEVRVLPWLPLRVGMFYDPSPVPSATLAPSSPDSNRLGVTVGAGAQLPWGFALDAFYGYVHMLGQPSENPENLAAEYGGKLHLVGVGLRYAYDRDDR